MFRLVSCVACEKMAKGTLVMALCSRHRDWRGEGGEEGREGKKEREEGRRGGRGKEEEGGGRRGRKRGEEGKEERGTVKHDIWNLQRHSH